MAPRDGDGIILELPPIVLSPVLIQIFRHRPSAARAEAAATSRRYANAIRRAVEAAIRGGAV